MFLVAGMYYEQVFELVDHWCSKVGVWAIGMVWLILEKGFEIWCYI